MTALIRRGSGIKKGTSRTVSKTSLRGVEAGSRRMRVQRGFKGFRSFGGIRGEKTAKHEKPEKRSGAVWLGYYAATSRILCRRFQRIYKYKYVHVRICYTCTYSRYVCAHAHTVYMYMHICIYICTWIYECK